MLTQATDNKVSLGCGTLIIIAVIVMIFSRGSDTRKVSDEVSNSRRDLRSLESRVSTASRYAQDAETETKRLKESVASLTQSVNSLRQAVNAQTESINQLKAELRKAAPAPAAATPPAKPEQSPVPPVERE